jgi:hypothetical protein
MCGDQSEDAGDCGEYGASFWHGWKPTADPKQKDEKRGYNFHSVLSSMLKSPQF